MPNEASQDLRPEALLLAVYAPFGTDDVLSTFPDGTSLSVGQHPLVKSLQGVAAAGVQVLALIDRVDDDTWLVDIPAGKPDAVSFTPRWKQDMAARRTLTGFLVEAHRRAPSAEIILSLEGHGAGYLPEVDQRRLTWDRVTQDGKIEWRFSGRESVPVDGDGNPVLPIGYPGLPIGYPGLPVNHRFMSTWALGQALQAAMDQGVPKLAVIHFDNCFNMSTEVLHTVSPFASHATSYNNYNFFTSGAAYPAVFQRLKSQGSAPPQTVAEWFADETHAMLAAVDGHPIVAGVVALNRMEDIAQGIDALSDALLKALRSVSGASREAVVNTIRKAVELAQQYDTEPGWELETPDQLTDVCSLAARLMEVATDLPEVQASAATLVKLLSGIKRYGDKDVPWLDDSGQIVWDFTEPTLAMNIFLPDPLLTGQWDWRSTYYMEVNPDPSLPQVQPGVIEFLKATNWVEFLVEYHRDVPFHAFHVGSIPQLPPQRREGGKSGGARTFGPRQPRTPWPLGRLGLQVVAWRNRMLGADVKP